MTHSVAELAAIWGKSQSTVRRRLREFRDSFPEIFAGESGNNGLALTDEQVPVFADWMAKRGEVAPSPLPVAQGAAQTPSEVTRATTAPDADATTIAVQRERIRGLEDRVAFLESEVERLHAALEREQEKSPSPQVGFFGWLRQKRLGDGR